MSKGALIWLVLLTTVLFSLPLVSAEKVNIVSETHSLINHEVILEIDAKADLTNLSKSWDFSINDLLPDRIENLRIEEQVTEVQQRESFDKVDCEPVKSRQVDINASLTTQYYCDLQEDYICQSDKVCYKLEHTMSDYPAIVWSKLNTPKETKNLLTKETKVNTTTLSVNKGKTKLIKVTWETPITLSEWGSSGEWSMNPMDWWNLIWGKKIRVDYTALAGVPTYQKYVLLDITTLGGAWADFAANTKADGTDVRFLNCDQDTELDYWREIWNDDVNGVFWVDIADYAGQTCFYIYYENAAASDVSSLFDTFVLDDTSSLADWFQFKNAGNDWTTDGNIFINDSTSGTQVVGKGVGLEATTSILMYSLDMNIDVASTDEEFRFYFSSDNNVDITAGTNTYFFTLLAASGNLVFTQRAGSETSLCTASATYTLGENDRFTVTRDDQNTFRIYQDGTKICHVPDSNVVTDGNFMRLSSAGDGIDEANDILTKVYLSEPEPTLTFGSVETPFLADFDFVVDPSSLDPAEGINSVNIDLNDTSTPGGKTIRDWNYFIEEIRFYTSTVDGNTTRIQTTAGDFNISLLITATDGNVSQSDQTVTVNEIPQDLDINFSYNTFTVNQADINFGVVFDGNGTAFNWSFPGDSNALTRNVQKTFTSSGIRNICVTVTSSDENRTICEDFFTGRVIVSIPKDIETDALLSPFSLKTSAFPVQPYTGLSADSNVFVFNDSTNFDSTVLVDFNSDYFPTSRIFTFNSFLHEYQPYLVPVEDNLVSTIFTIDNINQKQTIPGIKIVSETVIGGDLIIVESKESDITGTAEFHFEIGRSYILSFFDSNNSLIFSGTLNAKSLDTTLFAALAQQELFNAADPTSSFNLSWIPIVSQVNPDSDGNVTIANLINPFNTIIGDVNVFVSHLSDSNVVFQTVFTLDSSDQNQSFSYDINVTGFDNNFPLIVNIQVFDINGFQITNIYSKNYYFKTARVLGAFETLKEELGAFPVMFFAIIICASLIGLITLFSPTTNNNWVGVIAMVTTAFFVIITWIPLEAWLVSASMAVGMILWRDIEQ